VEKEPTRPGPPVAGIGTSAGGLDAFKRFLTAMPSDSRIASVLVPHLDPAQHAALFKAAGDYLSASALLAASRLSKE
jgi:two-component system CheB/CheR fusion protein